VTISASLSISRVTTSPSGLPQFIPYHQHGVHCLEEKYVFLNHPRKVALFHSVLSEHQRDKLRNVCSAFRVQPPDLLLYTPDRQRFWFAEVKGPGDRLSKKQRKSHGEITRRLSVPVDVINVRILSLRGRGSARIGR
jgi:hypothetical protein